MTKQLTVLLVDDDPDAREALAEVLHSLDIHLLVAKGAHKALRLLTHNTVDVLFTDVLMNEMDGIELAMRAKLLRPHIKVLFITGAPPETAEASALGTLLYKPARLTEIEDALTTLAETIG